MKKEFFRLVLAASIGVSALSASTANATTFGPDDCLLGCVVEGTFVPHSTLSGLGIVEARSTFTLPGVGDFFYGLTSLLPFDADFSLGQGDNGFGGLIGGTTFVPAGTQQTILIERSPLQEPIFTLQVSALDTLGTLLGTSVAVTGSSQSIDDMLTAQALNDLGYAEAGNTPIAELFAEYGFAATGDTQADAAALAAAIDAGQVAAVPLPASGILLLAGLGGFGMMRRKRA